MEVSAGLFAGNGYDCVSMREIATASGIKESSLYNHFSSKEQILENLFAIFSKKAPESRPTEAELEQMLSLMSPGEVFKNILFYVGRNIDGLLENIAIVINHEKFRNKLASEIYFASVVEEPAEYYTKLIHKRWKKV